MEKIKSIERRRRIMCTSLLVVLAVGVLAYLFFTRYRTFSSYLGHPNLNAVTMARIEPRPSCILQMIKVQDTLLIYAYQDTFGFFVDYQLTRQQAISILQRIMDVRVRPLRFWERSDYVPNTDAIPFHFHLNYGVESMDGIIWGSYWAAVSHSYRQGDVRHFPGGSRGSTIHRADVYVVYEIQQMLYEIRMNYNTIR